MRQMKKNSKEIEREGGKEKREGDAKREGLKVGLQRWSEGRERERE